MKLLLTSAGIRNNSIAHALKQLVGKDVSAVKVGLIPTAANVEEGSKDWFVRQLTSLQKYGFGWIDIIDISVEEVDWQKRLEGVDVIFMSGGNTFYLLEQIRKTGFDKWLINNLDTKVYVGVSAGSIVATPNIAVAGIDDGDENRNNLQDLQGLSLVNIELSPHTNGDVSHEANRAYSETIENELIGLDDESALLVTDDSFEVISEGQYLKY